MGPKGSHAWHVARHQRLHPTRRHRPGAAGCRRRRLAAPLAPCSHGRLRGGVRPGRGEDVPLAMSSWRGAFWGRPAVCLSPGDLDTWEHRYARVLAVLPYVLLGVSTLVSQFQPYGTLE